MKYGEDCQARTPLAVRYTKLGEDVRYNVCFIHPNRLLHSSPLVWYRHSRSLPVRSTLNAWVSRNFSHPALARIHWRVRSARELCLVRILSHQNQNGDWTRRNNGKLLTTREMIVGSALFVERLAKKT